MPSQRLDPAIAAAVRRSIATRSFELSGVIGGAFGKEPLQDACPDGVLIGFRLGLGRFFQNQVIKCIQPIYLTPSGIEEGPVLGGRATIKEIEVLLAPPGYAVGGLEIHGGGGLDAIRVIYMPFNGTRLDPTQSQITSRVGGPGGGVSTLDGNGTPIIGIHGVIDKKGDYLGLGVIFSQHVPDPRTASRTGHRSR